MLQVIREARVNGIAKTSKAGVWGGLECNGLVGPIFTGNLRPAVP